MDNSKTRQRTVAGEVVYTISWLCALALAEFDFWMWIIRLVLKGF